jgi:15-cis-phytoene synthase
MPSYRMAAPLLDTSKQRSADLAACRALLRSGSHSFHLASLLLPRRVGEAATALYAFCRLADDAIDLQGGAAALALDRLYAQLDRVYAGRPGPQPMERLLTRVVEEHGIPRALLAALLEGFEWDAAGRRYPTIAALNAYAARVAGSVGALMTLLMQVRTPAVLARACDLGVAMQLTNIARDVGQDARAGRLYLPLDWLAEAQVDAQSWLARPMFTPALGAVIERLLLAADALYARAAGGIGGLPADCRPGIHAARLLYAEIGHEVRRRGLDAVTRRAQVGALRKARLMCEALYAAMRPPSELAYTALAETQFLVDAIEPLTAASGDAAVVHGARAPQQGRAEWLIELFERLQQRDHPTPLGEGS